MPVMPLRYGPLPANGASPASSRLELVCAWPLWGVVEDMVVLRGRGKAGRTGQRDSIILAFR
jgi:hypothetical protein